MIKKILVFILILICVTETIYIVYWNKSFPNELVYSCFWTQYSAEYDALCYQAYNSAKKYILSVKDNSKKQAIILDIDETVLNNSPFEAALVKEQRYNPVLFEKWCMKSQAKAVCGAVDFCNFVKDNNIEIFYISNRPKTVQDVTIKNFKELNFPYADEQHLFLRTEDNNNKEKRINEIINMGYEIILYGEDNLSNLDTKIFDTDYNTRKQWVESNKDKFGSYYLIIPNIMYGNVDKSVTRNYSALSKKDKYLFKKSVLQIFNN